jgi:hypothetical protein
MMANFKAWVQPTIKNTVDNNFFINIYIIINTLNYYFNKMNALNDESLMSENILEK